MSPPSPNDAPRPLPTFARNALVALAYVGTAFVCGTLSQRSSFALAIWLPAGVAFAALHRFGTNAWPAVLVGAVTATTARLVTVGEGLGTALAISSVVGVGATLQALSARPIARRVLPGGFALDDAPSVLRFSLVCAPLSALVSPTVGALTLFASGQVRAALVPHAFFTWWVGDGLGILLVAPTFFALTRGADAVWGRRRLSVALPTVGALAVVTFAYVATARLEAERQRLDFERSVAPAGDRLADALDAAIVAPQTVRDFFAASKRVERGEFATFCDALLARSPSVQALEWAPLVTEADRGDHEASMRADGAPTYRIVERDDAERLVPARPREMHVPVVFVAPWAGNELALGYDLASDPVRRDMLERARAGVRVAASAPVRLVQETERQAGVLAVVPVGAPDRPSTPQGFAVLVLRVGTLIAREVRDHVPPGVRVVVSDVTRDGAAELLYESEPAEPQAPSARVDWQRSLPVGGRAWRLEMSASAGYLAAHTSLMPWAVEWSGLGFVVVLGSFLLVLSGRSARVESLVATRTEALADRNAQLDAIFALSPDGFVVLDQDGRIELVNPAFARIVGLPESALVGAYEHDLDEALRGRLASPELFGGVRTVFVDGRAGQDRPARVAFEAPGSAIVDLVGVRGTGPGVRSILCVRDVTREAEIDRMKSEFLASAAHELRTPMTSIFGFSELLLRRSLPDAMRREALETIYEQTKLLIDILNELLDLARIEARRGRDWDFESVDVAAIARERVAATHFDADRWPIRVVAPDTPVFVHADPRKLGEALGNVLANAIKYSPAGGAVDVVVTAPRDTWNTATIAVTDHGIGMSATDVARVGERFWRADSSGKLPGTGLGIAIVKEIVALHGGSLEITSAVGVGTTVTIVLPGRVSAPPASE